MSQFKTTAHYILA